MVNLLTPSIGGPPSVRPAVTASQPQPPNRLPTITEQLNAIRAMLKKPSESTGSPKITQTPSRAPATNKTESVITGEQRPGILANPKLAQISPDSIKKVGNYYINTQDPVLASLNKVAQYNFNTVNAFATRERPQYGPLKGHGQCVGGVKERLMMDPTTQAYFGNSFGNTGILSGVVTGPQAAKRLRASGKFIELSGNQVIAMGGQSKLPDGTLTYDGNHLGMVSHKGTSDSSDKTYAGFVGYRNNGASGFFIPRSAVVDPAVAQAILNSENTQIASTQ